MGRRRATRRTGMQKMQRLKHKHDADYEKWLDQLPTRREADMMVRAYLARYHEAEVVRLQELVAELAERAGIVPEPASPPEVPDPVQEPWQMDAPARRAWFDGRPECEVEEWSASCEHCESAGGWRYRYLAESPDYAKHHLAYPTPWYHQCGYATEPE